MALRYHQAYRSGDPVPDELRVAFCAMFRTEGLDQSLARYARTVLCGPMAGDQG